MTLEEMLLAWRRRIKDTKRPYLVSDEDGLLFANQAQCEAARRARLLVDSQSPMCAIAISVGDPVIPIDPKIISIRRARLSSRSVPLRKRRVRDMDEQCPGWDSSTSKSTPMVIVTDFGANQLYSYPTSNIDDVLMLTVTREPLVQLSDMGDNPEIAPRYHHGLISWMAYRAYLTDDADIYDQNQAAKALTEFESEFGPRISAVDEQFEFENYDDVGER